MWIGAINGCWLLEVQKKNPGYFSMKAFSKEELEILFDFNRISKTPDREGFYTVRVAKQELAEILIKLLKELEYENFTDALKQCEAQKEKHLVFEKFMNGIKTLTAE